MNFSSLKMKLCPFIMSQVRTPNSGGTFQRDQFFCNVIDGKSPKLNLMIRF